MKKFGNTASISNYCFSLITQNESGKSSSTPKIQKEPSMGKLPDDEELEISLCF